MRVHTLQLPSGDIGLGRLSSLTGLWQERKDGAHVSNGGAVYKILWWQSKVLPGRRSTLPRSTSTTWCGLVRWSSPQQSRWCRCNQYDEKMLSLTYLSSAEVHRPAGHQGDGDHHRHEGRKRQPPHPLQHLHHEEVDNNDGGKNFLPKRVLSWSWIHSVSISHSSIIGGQKIHVHIFSHDNGFIWRTNTMKDTDPP